MHLSRRLLAQPLSLPVAAAGASPARPLPAVLQCTWESLALRLFASAWFPASWVFKLSHPSKSCVCSAGLQGDTRCDWGGGEGCVTFIGFPATWGTVPQLGHGAGTSHGAGQLLIVSS